MNPITRLAFIILVLDAIGALGVGVSVGILVTSTSNSKILQTINAHSNSRDAQFTRMFADEDAVCSMLAIYTQKNGNGTLNCKEGTYTEPTP